MTDELDGYRAEVRDALSQRLALRDRDGARGDVSVLGAGSDDLETGRRYLAALADTGYATPTWPTEYGGAGETPERAAAIRHELAAFAVPDLYPYLVGVELVGPTLLAHGTSEQCARWLPPIARGDEIWCQLFSEPDAGSDLAGLATHAVRDGDTWTVRGQKVWTSRGHYSRWGLLLARTDSSVPKHSGITAFALDMHTRDVEVRPLRQMNGDRHFTEVFLDGPQIADTDRIGEVGDGWRVALTTLAFERGAVAGGGTSMLDPERLVALIRAQGKAHDPVLRDRLLRVIVGARVMSLTARRARDTAKAGRVGPEGSGLKLRGSALFRDYTDVAMQALGPAAACDPEGPWQTLFLTAPSLSIRGGTDEIQRNIVGERVLGLPGEPRVDRDVPFDRIPRSRPDS